MRYASEFWNLCEFQTIILAFCEFGIPYVFNLQIKDQKRNEELRQSEIVEKLARIEELEQNMLQMKEQVQNAEAMQGQLQQLHDAGLLKQSNEGLMEAVGSI